MCDFLKKLLKNTYIYMVEDIHSLKWCYKFNVKGKKKDSGC